MLRLHSTLFLLVGLVLAGPLSAQENDYAATIEAHRAEQHQHFLDAEESPLTKEDRAHFEGLQYFDINQQYQVQAKFKRTRNEKPFKMNTSSGKLREYVKYGVAKFELNGKKMRLNLYRNLAFVGHPEYGNSLFVPFTDPTNGDTSYGGGRYLDIEIPEGKALEIDFNRCYNPYCAYSDGWSCPIPPRENDLSVPIEAGVKQWQHAH